MRKILFNQDSSGGNGAPGGQLTEPTTASAAPPAVVPPAAATVINGDVTEETIRLKEQLTEKERLLKQRETEIAAAKDEHERYRLSVETPQNVPIKKAAEPKARRFGFLSR